MIGACNPDPAMRNRKTKTGRETPHLVVAQSLLQRMVQSEREFGSRAGLPASPAVGGRSEGNPRSLTTRGWRR